MQYVWRSIATYQRPWNNSIIAYRIRCDVALTFLIVDPFLQKQNDTDESDTANIDITRLAP